MPRRFKRPGQPSTYPVAIAKGRNRPIARPRVRLRDAGRADTEGPDGYAVFLGGDPRRARW